MRQALQTERADILSAYQNSMKANEMQINKLNTKIASLSSLDPRALSLIDSYNAKINKHTKDKADIYAAIDASISEKIAMNALLAKNVMV